MKKKIFMLLAFVMAAMTASATDVPTYSLTKADGAEAHGTITFKVGENAVTSAKEGDVVTVTITPATGWVVNQPSGQWFAAIAAAPQRRTGIDLLKGVTLTPVQGQENQWQFTMARANVEINTTYKKLMTHTDITVADITAPTYTGQALTPTVTVKDGETALVLNTDYTVAYSNNTNAAQATATSNAPTVTITGIGEKYAGTATKTFTINKAALTVTAENKTVTFGDDAPTYSVTYDGFVNNETNAVLGGTLAFDCGYVKNQSGVDEYTITPSGLTSDNYAITFTAGKLTVGKKALAADLIATIPALTYTGSALEPAPVVTFNEMTLVAGADKDYTVAYSNNTNAGTATVTITATENCNYSGSASKTFTIEKAEITSMTAPTIDELTYNGEEQVLVNAGSVEGGTVNYSLDGQTYAADVPTAKDAGPYIVYYKVVPDDNHFTNLAAQFVLQTIYKVALTAVTLKSAELTYNKQEQTPEISSVSAGDFTVSADDYEVSGSGTNVGTYMLTVTAKSTAKNFTGSTSLQWSIVPKTVGLTWSKTTMDANGQEQLPELTLTGIEEGDACTATVTGAAIPVGTHTAKVTALSNENYALPKDSLCTFIIVRDMSNLFSDSYEWTTYVAQEDLATPAGLQAYVVSKVTTTTIEAAAVGYIPVGTGVLLKRTDKTANAYKGAAYEGTPANIASLLKGSATAATTLTSYKDFLLYRDEFVMSSTNSIPAGRAYLPAAEVPAQSAPSLTIVFEGGTTKITNTNITNITNGNWYDLNGRKLNGMPTKKGIYMNNGRKVVVK